MKVLVGRLCPILCDPMDYSPPGSPVHGILKATILEWVAIAFSWGSSQLGIEPGSPALQVGCYCLRHQGSPGELAMCQSGHWGSLEESDPLLHPPVKVVVTLAAVYMHFPCARDYTHIFSILSGVVSKTIL